MPPPSRDILILREPEIRRLLDPAACITAVEAALTAYSTGRAMLPDVIGLEIPEHRGEIHVKAGHLRDAPHYAVKVASGFPDNPARGHPSSDGLVLVFDARTGELAALLLDRGYLTDLRTAAAGAVAARHLARREIRTVGVVGSGGQARHQLRLLALVRPFEEVRIWGRHPDRAQACAEELAGDASLAGKRFQVADSVRGAVELSDLVITVTASREPLVRSEWIAPGTHVTAVGSDGPDKQELDPALLARADRVVADSLSQCTRLGEIHHALAAGVLTEDRIAGELGLIAAGMRPGRRSESEITIADLTGVGVQDVAAASLVLDRARAAGAGTWLDR